MAAVARPLLAAVDSITVEEFRAQDLTFDRDSRRGRELLHLMADAEWLLETAEAVDVRLAHAVETTLRLTVDPGRIRHEAFGDEAAVPLPLLTLPLVSGARRRGGVPAEAAPSLTVTDRDGASVAAMAPGEVRRIVGAALAEIVLKVAGQRWPGPGSRPVGRRAERLVLGAALHRMLRDRGRAGDDEAEAPGPPDPPDPSAADPAADAHPAHPGDPDGPVPDRHHGLGRLRAAQAEVRRALTGLAGDQAAAAGIAGVVDALANSLCLVLVVPRDGGPRTYTVRLPARRLVRHGDTTLRRPRARLEVDLLLTGADADRRFMLTLPDGVAWEPVPGTPDAAAQVTVDVGRPRSASHLAALVDQLVDPARGPAPAPVARCLADMAVSRVDAVRETLSHHRVPDPGLPARLRDLRAALASDAPGVAAAWRAVRLPAGLRRDTSLGAVSPGTVEARTERIDDRAHHGRPAGARAVVDVAVTDSELLSSARFAGGMNLVLMTAVLLFLLRSGAHANVEVIAPALTLFAAVQAGRVAPPDASTFRGMLAATGYWLVIPSILPTVILAVALAFVYRDDVPATRLTAAACAAVAIAGQLAFQLVLHRGPLAVSRVPARPPGLVLSTPPLVDHERLGRLSGAWWRATVAEALLLGRDAHAFLVWDRGERVPGAPADPDAWVAPHGRSGDDAGRAPANVLAVLRSGTPRQALSFVVFREPPPAAWAAAHDARPVELATHRLAPRQAPAELLDVFVGIPRGSLPAVSGHPITQVLRIAAGLSLRAVDVQLPAPPPVRGGADRRWLRVRVGVDEARLHRCRDFLEALHAATAAGGWEVLLQVVPEIEARTTFTAPAPRVAAGALGTPPAGTGRAPLPAGELDVLDADGPDADAPLWCVLALCGHARTGLEADVLETLGAHHPGLRLGGITSAVLHGTSVSLLLLRRTPDGEAPDVAKLVAEYAGDDLTAPLAEAQSAAQLGTPPGPGRGPLLRVHLRAHDRPGLVADTLHAVRAALLAALGEGAGGIGAGGIGIGAGDLVPWHVRGEVADGRTTTVRLTLRLPEGAPVARWTAAAWEDVERDVRRGVAAGGDEPVVGVHLVRAPGHPSEPGSARSRGI